LRQRIAKGREVSFAMARFTRFEDEWLNSIVLSMLLLPVTWIIHCIMEEVYFNSHGGMSESSLYRWFSMRNQGNMISDVVRLRQKKSRRQHRGARISSYLLRILLFAVEVTVIFLGQPTNERHYEDPVNLNVKFDPERKSLSELGCRNYKTLPDYAKTENIISECYSDGPDEQNQISNETYARLTLAYDSNLGYTMATALGPTSKKEYKHVALIAGKNGSVTFLANCDLKPGQGGSPGGTAMKLEGAMFADAVAWFERNGFVPCSGDRIGAATDLILTQVVACKNTREWRSSEEEAWELISNVRLGTGQGATYNLRPDNKWAVLDVVLVYKDGKPILDPLWAAVLLLSLLIVSTVVKGLEKNGLEYCLFIAGKEALGSDCLSGPRGKAQKEEKFITWANKNGNGHYGLVQPEGFDETSERLSGVEYRDAEGSRSVRIMATAKTSMLKGTHTTELNVGETLELSEGTIPD
jgi:hypothetical protein